MASKEPSNSNTQLSISLFCFSFSGNDDVRDAVQNVCESPKILKCTCGKNNPNTPTCMTGKKSKCPCVKNKQSCSRGCRCKFCQNRSVAPVSQAVKETNRKGCSCGRNGGDKSSIDVEERAKSRCPCLQNGQGCSELTCSCKNCRNIHGMNQMKTNSDGFSISTRKGNKVKTFKREKGESFLINAGVKVLQGMWTSDETIVFAVLLKLLSKTSLKPSVENLLFLYNWTVGVVGTECGLKIRPKSRNQITGKLEYVKKLTSFHNS